MTNNCQILCIFCLQLTSSLRAAITSVRSVPQDVLFSAGFVLDLCLLQWVLKWNTSNQFLLSWNVYQLSACWIWIWYKDAFVCIVHGNTSGLMYLASWQEAFPVCGRILLLRLIYGCLGAVSCHLFRGKKKKIKAWSCIQKQSKLVLESWGFMWMYRKASSWGNKVTCQSRQLFAIANCFSNGFVTCRILILVPRWQQLWFLIPWGCLMSRHTFSGGRTKTETRVVTLLLMTKIQA